MKRVVITGMGAVTPLGNTVKEFWHNLVDGKLGIGKLLNLILKILGWLWLVK